LLLQALVTPEPLSGLTPERFPAEGSLSLGAGVSAAARMQALAGALKIRPDDWSEGHTALTIPHNPVGVFIGIDQYKDTNIHGLHCAAKDAKDTAATMRKTCGLTQTWVLTDQMATLMRIRKVLCEEVIAATGPGDPVILYWSGHGGYAAGDTSDSIHFLVPYDGLYLEDDRK
jgi:hypothetical protein